MEYYVAKEGILSISTIRRNKIPDCKLSSEKIMMKKIEAIQKNT